MRWIALVLIIATASATAAEKVYKIVRPDGTVEYSSEPEPGAEPVQVPELPTYQPRRVPPSTSTGGEPKQPEETATDYSITVTRPSQDETVFFDAAGLSVSASVDPALDSGEGHAVVFVLDGNPGERISGTGTTLDVERGTHTLVARVEDENGQVLARSQPVTFHMRQHSRRQPAPATAPGGAARSLP